MPKVSLKLVVTLFIILSLLSFYLYQSRSLTTPHQNLNPQVNDEKVRIQKEKCPKLASQLCQLALGISTQNSGLDIKNNQVQVTIEVNHASFELPSNYGQEEARYETRIQARVYTNQLLQLQDLKGVVGIDVPMRGYPADN